MQTFFNLLLDLVNLPGLIRNLFRHRQLISILTWRDFRARYRGSFGGLFWSFFQPLVMMVIYTLVFSGFLKIKFGVSDSPFAFSVVLLCGLLPWTAFSESWWTACTDGGISARDPQPPMGGQRRQASLEGIFFILALVPIDDTGGGARSAQIARELLRRGYLVRYLNKYPSFESVDLKLQICHPNLIVQPFSRFSFKKFKERINPDLWHKKIGALVELPNPESLPLIDILKAHGGRIVYDLLDDWNSALGWDWYSLDVERKLVKQADVLVATTPPYLFLSENLVEYIGNIQQALQVEIDAGKLDEFVCQNSWQARVDQIISITGYHPGKA